MRAALYFLLAPFACAGVPDHVLVSEGGGRTGYVVATDEAGHFHRNGTAHVEKITQQQNGARTIEFLKSHRPAAAEKGSDLILYEAGRPRSAATRRWLTAKVIAQLAPGANVADIAAAEIGRAHV